MNLDVVSESLVELGNLVGNGEVNSAVADLDNETTKNVRVDLVGDLEGLALTNEGRLGNGGLETVESLVVESGGRGDSGLNNTLGGVGKSLELVDNGGNERESVVVGKETKEVADGLVGLDGSGEGGDNRLLVLRREGRVLEDGGELGVVLEDGLEGRKGVLDGGESRRLDGSGVLKACVSVCTWSILFGTTKKLANERREPVDDEISPWN